MLPALRLSRSCHRPLVMRAFQRSYGSNSSVDAEEVKKFNAMSQQWWDPDGEFGMLQLMNPVRVRYIRDQLPQNDNETHPFKGLRMLDIGCGGGLLSESLARLGGQVVGADASFDNIQMAKLHSRKDPRLWRGPGSVEYRHTLAEDLLEAKESFDVVSAMEIIEHVSNPLAFLQTCGDLVRPGGSLFLSTMSRTLHSYLLTVLLAEDILGIVHKGTHDWTKYINSKELIAAVDSIKGGWTVQDVRGIFWDPLKRKWWLSEKNGHIAPCGIEALEVNYLLTAKRNEN
ncbi:3-demethylubiquinone-9 3-methyltransferase [Lichtheimia corymbifera JMRC:FSU:9682]|uniref:Ubiquinone biosynthesis O-methyltransferase, mitochondrial n=1 Tax=Lichtheimia corymbifera JMRC:FSU:9682 TaxID=1263082 RepID=A0A068S3U7_9FUNG|nr:3-demethylubiquinone-9 3-methyltransferase [Lichtheimia corymbifera JMRC:FSU:9682]